MITAELAKKIDLLPQESYSKVEDFVEQLIALNMQEDKETAFRIFTDKMNEAEQCVRENGYYTEEEVEAEWELEEMADIKRASFSESAEQGSHKLTETVAACTGPA